MAHEPGGDQNQIDRPESTSTLSHPVGDENGPQSATMSDAAAERAVNGHPDQEIQTGAHQPATPAEAREIIDREVSQQTGEDSEDNADDESAEETDRQR